MIDSDTYEESVVDSLVKNILAAAGKPVAGHTLSVNEMKRAVAEGRVLEIFLWGSMGRS